MNPNITSLNPEQQQAVLAFDHHLLIVAGAGSGKTKVLTTKIAHLIEHKGVHPGQILAMTFSNKAANEMRERVAALLPSFALPFSIGTFHATCLKFLKEFHVEAGLAQHFSIYDDSDQLSVIKKAIEDLNLDPKKTSPKLVRYYIDRAKNESLDFVGYISEHFDISDDVQNVAERYEKLMKANSALDFADLVGKTLKLLKENPSVKEKLSNRYERILIDEYQDTNDLQKQLIQHLCGSQTIVCAVGDEDQSIYAWRGARVENMLNFPHDFPGAQIIKLEQNYRSTGRILSAANQVIAHNKGRREKKLWTQNPDGTFPKFEHLEDDYAEARFVFETIERRSLAGENYNHFAIFYRTHSQSRLLEEECRKRGIPYKIFGGMKFFDRQEIKDTLTLLKLLVNPADNVAFLRMINTPSKGIGKQALAKLADLADPKGLSLFNAIPYLDLSSKADKALCMFHEWFTTLQIESESLGLVETTEKILDLSGYQKMLENEQTFESQARLDNIDELLRSMAEFESTTSGSVAQYLDRISLYTDQDSTQNTNDTVVLMTIHNSKGLEFNTVFLVGMEEGVFPHYRSLEDQDPNELEEERRLCYVAMTRAQKHLYLSATERRYLYNNVQYNPVSRFISEIPASMIERGFAAASMQKHTGFQRSSFAQKYQGHLEDDARQESYDDQEPTWQINAPIDPTYKPGTQVLHPTFGQGTIRNVDGDPQNLKLTIQFAKAGTKKILLNYCQLEVLSR